MHGLCAEVWIASLSLSHMRFPQRIEHICAQYAFFSQVRVRRRRLRVVVLWHMDAMHDNNTLENSKWIQAREAKQGNLDSMGYNMFEVGSLVDPYAPGVTPVELRAKPS